MQPDAKVLRESCIVIGNASVTDLEFNPLTSMSDQNRPSRYNIITLSSRKVMRIRKTINQGFVDPITLARDCKNKTVFHWKAQTLACKREEREKNPTWLRTSCPPRAHVRLKTKQIKLPFFPGSGSHTGWTRWEVGSFLPFERSQTLEISADQGNLYEERTRYSLRRAPQAQGLGIFFLPRHSLSPQWEKTIIISHSLYTTHVRVVYEDI